MHVNVKLDLVAEAALPLVRDGAAGAARRGRSLTLRARCWAQVSTGRPATTPG
jgi:hypothetical protein